MATETVILDCARITNPDLAAIDRLARFELAAQRCGCRLRLRNPNLALRELVGLAGLERVLVVEVQRQPE